MTEILAVASGRGGVPVAGGNTLPVSEVFHTLQGEGPSAGRLASFIRLGGCNLTCSGCDSAYTWDASRYDLRAELTPMTVGEIMGRLTLAPLIVLTGGEPMMYQHYPAMADLLAELTRFARVEVETNGTQIPAPWLTARPGVSFNVSPKLDGPMSSDAFNRRIRPAALLAFAELAEQDRAVFKFVVRSREDVAQAIQVVDGHGIPRHRVWVMPEGTTPATVLRHAQDIAEPVIAAGVNLTLRQHVLLWPDTGRGR